MFNRDNTFYLGKITKLKGVKGELHAFFDVDNPAQYFNLGSVLLDVNGSFIPYFISSIQFKGNKATVRFEDVNTIEQAQELTGLDMYLPLEQLPKLGEKQFYYHEIIHFEVHDLQKGKLGKIEKIMDYPNNPLLLIMNADGKEILVPINDDTIQRVDRKEQKVWVEMPEGLLDIYLNPDA